MEEAKATNPCNLNKPFQKEKTIFKVIVVGDASVGKTCLTYRFCEGHYLDKPEATIGVDFRERLLNINGDEIKLQIWDTAGQERFRKAMVPHYYRNTHAVIVVYDVTKMSSFKSVAVWLDECEEHGLTDHLPRILVGNKCDCIESQEVSTSLAQRLADSHNMPLFETSAQSDSECDNIEAIFVTLAHMLVKQRSMMTVPIGSEKLQQTNTISITSAPVASPASSCFC